MIKNKKLVKNDNINKKIEMINKRSNLQEILKNMYDKKIILQAPLILCFDIENTQDSYNINFTNETLKEMYNILDKYVTNYDNNNKRYSIEYINGKNILDNKTEKYCYMEDTINKEKSVLYEMKYNDILIKMSIILSYISEYTDIIIND